MRFADLYEGWQIGRLSQQEAAEALGVSDRTFRRFSRRFEEDGANGLLDRRVKQLPTDERTAGPRFAVYF
jgi:transposase